MSNEQHASQSGETESLDAALSGESGAPLVARVDGLAATHLQQRRQALRESADRAGVELFLIGGVAPSGDRTRFKDVVRQFVSDLSERGELSDRARRLFEFLFQRSRGGDSVDIDSTTYRNSLCRLWAELTQALPAVLAISHPRRLPDAEQAVLRQLVEYYYLDPIDEMLSGEEVGAAPKGGIVWLEQPAADTPWVEDDRVVTLEGGKSAETSVRSFLERDIVIERLVEATEGDPQRLEALVDALPSDTASIWKMRLRELDEVGRELVAVLGAGGGTLPVKWFEAAADELIDGNSVGRATTELTDAGFIEKRISDGQFQIALFDDQIGEVALDRLGRERRREVYGALVDGIESLEVSEADVGFMADILLEAGRLEQGVRLGIQAARRHFAETSLQQAQAWFERLLEVTEGTDVRREILEYLVEIYAKNGHIEAAFEGLDELSELTGDPTERVDAELEVIGKLIHTGDPDSALDRAEALREELETVDEAVSRRLQFVEAKALSKSGERQQARETLESLLSEPAEGLETTEDELSERECDEQSGRLLVEARNELANIAMFNGELDRADALYDQNRKVAEFHGWREEIDRAAANKAIVDSQQGDYEAALETFQDVLDNAPMSVGLKRAKLMLNKATSLERLDEFDRAIQNYRSAIREARRVGDVVTFGYGAFNLASLLQRMGAFGEAKDLLERFRGKESSVPGYGVLEWYPTARYCDILSLEGNLEEAINEFEEIEGAEPGIVPWVGRWLKLRVARIYVAVGREDRAEALVDEVVSSKEEGDLNDKNAALSAAVRAAIALEHGELERAREASGGTIEQCMEAGDILSAAFAARVRIRLDEACDDEAAVIETLTEVLSRLEEQVDRTPDAYSDRLYDIPVYQWLLQRVLDYRDRMPDRLVVTAEHHRDDTPEDSEQTADRDNVTELRRKFPQIVGRDDSLIDIFRRVDQVAESEAPVLIEGESGTGKELVANAVHRHSDRTDEPFVKLNCGAFVDELLMSELFGHEKGAFTGAVEQKEGRFEQADGGTIFLDEIGDISPKAQVSLLRVLQSGEFERVGGTETHHADVRVVCATHRSLDELVEAGEFRLDLYYRLKGIVLELPALRDRRRDIPLLVRHFAERFSEETPVFSRRALQFLCSYSWPGNVRELKNFVRTLLLFTEEPRVELSDIRGFQDFFAEGDLLEEPPEFDLEAVPESIVGEAETSPESVSEPETDEAPSQQNAGEGSRDSSTHPEEAIVEELISGDASLNDLKSRLEEQSIVRALRETDGNITRAAELLDMTRPRLSQIVNSDDRLLALKEELVS